MSAIFISYTGRDPEGDAWADRLTEWFTEWGYGYFRGKDYSNGVAAGEDWRQTLRSELAEATAMVCLCSKEYDRSPWCVGEMAIALEKGKTVIPIQLAKTLPLLLQMNQAIKVLDAVNPSAEQLAEVKHRLQATLQEKLNWRDLQPWDRSQPPYPGLPAFQEYQAPVFFGRDDAIEAVVQCLTTLALRPPAFLLLLGASGYGKSSLVRAGVVPRLKGDRQRNWMVLPPFRPGNKPFNELAGVVGDAGGVFDASDPLRSLKELRRQSKAPVVLVIDQFEELLEDGNREEDGFLAFLQRVLSTRDMNVVVLATLRSNHLDTLQIHCPALAGMASTMVLKPLQPSDYGELIDGPAHRSGLILQPGLRERLIADSGGEDALPLLAFTLEKLWQMRQKKCGPVQGPRGEWWDLTVQDYEALGGVAGAVGNLAVFYWAPQSRSSVDTAALREAFLGHLVRLNENGLLTKTPAKWDELPELSRPLLKRFVDARLLVASKGWEGDQLEIAHEALLRTWPTLMQWIDEARDALVQEALMHRRSARVTDWLDDEQRTPPPSVFISYAREDEETARHINQLFKDKSFNTWLDKDRLAPGAHWDREIREAIMKSNFVVILFSRKTIGKRGYIQKEVRMAIEESLKFPDGQVFIIPVRLEECSVPYSLDRYHYCDFFEEGAEELLVDAISKHWRQAAESTIS